MLATRGSVSLVHRRSDGDAGTTDQRLSGGHPGGAEGLRHLPASRTGVRPGLAPEAIVGVLLRPLEPGERITPVVFARNRAFVDFLHEVIARRGPTLAG